MSKVIAGMAAVVLGGGAAAGTVILLPKWLNRVDAELPTTLTDFKTGVKDEGCVQRLFGGLKELPSVGTDSSATNNIDENFLESGKKTEGCLVVNWDKDTYDNSKWKGTIRFLWAVKGSNNKGFIVFLAGEASNNNTDKEIKWEAASYSLSSAETDGVLTWTAKQNQEIQKTNNKAFKKGSSDSNLDSKKFPAPGEALNLTDNSAYWSFFEANSGLDSICSSSECTSGEPTKTQFRGYWDWEGTEDASSTDKKNLADWSKEWDTWWKEVFEETKFKAKDLTAKHKGTWVTRLKQEPPKKGTDSN